VSRSGQINNFPEKKRKKSVKNVKNLDGYFFIFMRFSINRFFWKNNFANIFGIKLLLHIFI
jgi:hypothetical protein